MKRRLLRQANKSDHVGRVKRFGLLRRRYRCTHVTAYRTIWDRM